MKSFRFLVSLIIAFTGFLNPSYAQFNSVQEQSLFQKDYLINGGFESGVSNWRRYSDAAGAAPVDCTGGSPTVTLTASTTNPLVGKSSGVLAKPASNVQGQGYAIDFVIDKSAKTKVLTVSADYEITSGTYSPGTISTDSDTMLYLYDVTGGALIYPAGNKFDGYQSNQSYKLNAVFQTPHFTTDTRTLRLCVHHATASASAYTIRLDSVKVGQQIRTQGPPITSMQSYTPGFDGLGTPTNVEMYWRRVGDSIHIQGRFAIGTPSGSTIRVGFPNGLVAATFTANQIVGAIYRSAGASSYVKEYTAIAQSGGTGINLGIADGSVSADPAVPVVGTGIGSAGQILLVNAMVKIAGWESTVLMSENADTRVVAMRASGTPTGTISGSPTTTIFGTVEYDTHGAYSASTGVYTCPVSGMYKITAGTNITTTITAGNGVGMYAYKGGSTIAFNYIRPAATTSTQGPSVSTDILCSAGETLSVRTFSEGSSNSFSAGNNFLAISRISGPSQIAANETIAASYHTTAAATASTTQPVQWNNRDFDTHNAVTTGTSWRFTAPASGIYRVSASYVNSTGNTSVLVYKNGVSTNFSLSDSGTGLVAAGSGSIRLNAGEYIDVRTSSSVSIPANGNLRISIERIGL